MKRVLTNQSMSASIWSSRLSYILSKQGLKTNSTKVFLDRFSHKVPRFFMFSFFGFIFRLSRRRFSVFWGNATVPVPERLRFPVSGLTSFAAIADKPTTCAFLHIAFSC